MAQQTTVSIDLSPTPDTMLDARGVPCPGPVLKAKKLLRYMKSGEVLQLLTDCTAAVDDIPAWSRESSIELLSARRLTGAEHEFYLRKG